MPEVRAQPISVGRYLLYRQVARGGMATIHIARLMGDVGFSRIVAAKRLHPELVGDAEFIAMFLDEARIASKVHHRNVVPVLDVVTLGAEVVLFQEYVHGVPLSWLLRAAHVAKTFIPIPVAASIACQILDGLHAAHETRDELGTPLQIVHRDVSPQNVMIATDGTARLLDFGVAKAAMAAHITREGMFKGKLAYSAPEQVRGAAKAQSDVYSLSVVLWEMIVGHRLHDTKDDTELIGEIMAGSLPTITSALAEERSWIGSYRWSQLEALEPIIRKGLAGDLRRRWSSAAAMEEAITAAVPLAPAADVAAWLKALGKEFLDGRDKIIAEEEASWRRAAPTRALSPALVRVRRRSTLAVTLCSALAVILAFGITVLVHAATVVTEPSPPPPPAIAIVEPLTTSTVAIAPPPIAPPIAAPVARKQTIVHPRAVHAAPRPPAAPAARCDPPYYFEGEKKIFRSACL